VFSAEDDGIRVRMENDDTFAYVTVAASDAAASNRLALTGLTIWFDHEGGKSRDFGIRYPLGAMNAGLDRSEMRNREQATQDERFAMRDQALQEMDIRLGEGEADALRFQKDAVPGIGVHLSDEYGRMTYVLQVPLKQTEDFEYAIGVEPGTVIGLGFEGGQMDRSMMADARESGGRAMGGGMRGGGMQGGAMSGGRPGGSMGQGGRRPGGAAGMSNPIGFWLKVNLPEIAASE